MSDANQNPENMNDSKQDTGNFDGELNRRSFLGAAGAVSISQINSINTLLSNSEKQGETHFIEAALEFEVLDDGISPAMKDGPYQYNAVRDKNALFALYGLESEAYNKLVTAETVTFGLESFKTGDATFAKDGLSVLPTLASNTPLVNRYFRLDQWSEAPTYSVRSSENDSAIVTVADKTVEVESDTAQRIALDTQEIPSARIPGYDKSSGLSVSPRLEVRNYGQMRVFDARDKAWTR